MIKQVLLSDIPFRSKYKVCSIQKDILDFIYSDWPACEVDATAYKTPVSVRNAYAVAIKRLRVGVTVVQRGERVFMIKEQ